MSHPLFGRVVIVALAFLFAALTSIPGRTQALVTGDFENLSLALDESFSGEAGTGTDTQVLDEFTLVPDDDTYTLWTTDIPTGGALMRNYFIEDYGSWSGFAYSNEQDTTTPGFTNDPFFQITNGFSAFAGGGAGPGQDNFGVAFGSDTTDLAEMPSIEMVGGARPISMKVTNTTWAAISMRDGDGFGKQFSTADDDYFLLTLRGTDAAGAEVGTPIEVYLADFRFGNASILDTWQEVDLAPLAEATRLHFQFASSDSDPTWGMNTPAYVAIDDIVTTAPEPVSALIAVALAMGLIGRPRRRR